MTEQFLAMTLSMVSSRPSSQQADWRWEQLRTSSTVTRMGTLTTRSSLRHYGQTGSARVLSLMLKGLMMKCRNKFPSVPAGKNSVFTKWEKGNTGSETVRSCVWFVSCARLLWYEWVEGGWPWMSSLLRMTHVEQRVAPTWSYASSSSWRRECHRA